MSGVAREGRRYDGTLEVPQETRTFWGLHEAFHDGTREGLAVVLSTDSGREEIFISSFFGL